MKTTARFDGNNFMVAWFGGREELTATLEENHGYFIITIDTNDDYFYKPYKEFPSADKVLQDFLNWQVGG